MNLFGGAAKAQGLSNREKNLELAGAPIDKHI
jgi:hypothetical protein